MPLAGKPIFIIGSPRSGTTLMRSIVDAHPNIFCPTWETGLFVHLGAMLNGDLLKVMRQEGDRFPLSRVELIDWARQAATQLLERFGARSGKARWAEKTPAHVHHVDLIREVFPDVQFVHMIRNGYDVVKSLQNMPWAPRRIRWSTQTWVASVRAGREAGARLPGGCYTEVRYEELIRQPRETLERLCNYLGEPFAPQMLAFHEPQRNSWKASLQPLQNRPVNEYQHLGLLERLQFAWSAGRLMRELGYQ
jgi:hypothetical protein